MSLEAYLKSLQLMLYHPLVATFPYVSYITNKREKIKEKNLRSRRFDFFLFYQGI